MQVERVGPYLWRIPRNAGAGMRVPGLVVADEVLMAHIRSEAALAQLANGATLPGIVKAALAMPDIHQGYGLPVGGVVIYPAAFPRTALRLARHGLMLSPVDVSELAKAEGAVTCCSIILES